MNEAREKQIYILEFDVIYSCIINQSSLKLNVMLMLMLMLMRVPSRRKQKTMICAVTIAYILKMNIEAPENHLSLFIINFIQRGDPFENVLLFCG